jgi:16S rRNA (uracil1498-N3)-methyltransferase
VVVGDLDSPELDESDRHHLGKALRLRPGEQLSATDGRGGIRPLVWKAGGQVQPAGEIVREPRPSPPVAVAFPPVKGDRPDWAVQKLTELGVDRILLLHTDRTVVRWEGDRGSAHLLRLRRVAKAAVMQSRGRWLPEVSAADFDSLRGCGDVAMAVQGAAGRVSLARPILLIGPEGGWSAGEESAPGITRVGLGPTVLRSETAAVAAGVLLCALRSGLVASA